MTSDENMRCTFRFLGGGKNKSVILSSICLVTISFFYFFVVGSALHTIIYTFQFRVTYKEIFVTHIASPNLDTLILLLATLGWSYLSVKTGYVKYAILVFFAIFIVSLFLNMTTIALAGAVSTLPIVSCLIILDRFRSERLLSTHYPALLINYTSIVAIGLAALGFINLFVFISTGVTTTLGKYPYAIYQQLLSILTPVVMAGLVFCIPLKVLLIQIISRTKIKGNSITIASFQDKLSHKRITIYLFLCIILGVTMTLVPHISVINPHNERLGVDTPRYETWLTLMDNQTVSPTDFALKSAGDRPLTLLILFLITETTNADPFQVIEYSPIILAPLLILVTFYLTRQLTANDKIAIIASFLSAISFQTLIGIYSGFYANWLALVLGYAGFGVLVRCLKRPSKFGLVILGLLMIGLLFAHTYTWTIMISVSFVFLFV